MHSRRLKKGYFILEGLNSFATVYYFYYFYFFMQREFGYDNRANLLLAALNGAVYALFAWAGGRFAQRFGPFLALKTGFAIMLAALAAGTQAASAPAHILVMALTVVGMCFTWPTLEGLVSEGENRAGIQSMVGIYNITWAGTGALGFFIGGNLLDHLGLRSLFYVPIGVLLIQLALTFWLEASVRKTPHPAPAEGGADSLSEPHPHAPAKARRFLRMAWLANPFAYVAVNTVIAVLPGVASKLGLSITLAGFLCSLWCFARVGAFVLLWLWTGWHYRFSWLLASYLALIASFALIVTAPGLTALVLSQILFGGALGLIYYSSLFYSMDLSDTKSEHGGIHEAAIGLGNFAGPAAGAAWLSLSPHSANGGAAAVSVVLVLGLAGLLTIWFRRD